MEIGKGKLIIALILVILLIDQLSKYFIRISNPNLIFLDGFFSIVFIQNTGASFGMFSQFPYLLLWANIIIIGLFLFYYDKIPKNNKTVQVAYALIIGGALGNLVDRIFFGAVSDFINFLFWPAFNFADSAIFIGAILFIIYFWKNK